MRQRKTKNLEEKLLDYDHLLIKKEDVRHGHWLEDAFGNKIAENAKLYVEIGCGKGRFITEMVKENPDDYFIAVEGQPSVAHKALRLAESMDIANLRFYLGYVDLPEEMWAKDELSGIYLNFSDPWPKKRHAKRRLTHHKKLIAYSRLVGKDGFIQFKTDNDGLFESALEEIEIAGLQIAEMTRDLHNSKYAHNNIMTEYEEKFSNRGEKINMVRIMGM